MKGETKVIDLGPLPHLSVGDKPTKPKDKDDPAAPSPVPGTPNKDRRGASASTVIILPMPANPTPVVEAMADLSVVCDTCQNVGRHGTGDTCN